MIKSEGNLMAFFLWNFSDASANIQFEDSIKVILGMVIVANYHFLFIFIRRFAFLRFFFFFFLLQ